MCASLRRIPAPLDDKMPVLMPIAHSSEPISDEHNNPEHHHPPDTIDCLSWGNMGAAGYG
jgi:hypothetical protein